MKIVLQLRELQRVNGLLGLAKIDLTGDSLAGFIGRPEQQQIRQFVKHLLGSAMKRSGSGAISTASTRVIADHFQG